MRETVDKLMKREYQLEFDFVDSFHEETTAQRLAHSGSRFAQQKGECDESSERAIDSKRNI